MRSPSLPMRGGIALFVFAIGCGQSVAVHDAAVDGGDGALDDGGRRIDAGHDAGRDAGRRDAAVRLPDAGRADAGQDAGDVDDAGIAPGAAAALDAGSDAGVDADVDAGMPVPGDAIAELGASGNGSCLRTVTNQMWCWGHGLTAPTFVAEAVQLRGTCGVARDGEAFCWGPGSSAAPVTTDYAGTDVAVLGLLAYASRPSGEVLSLGLSTPPWAPPAPVASMPAQFCAILTDGGLTCWDWELGPSRFTSFWNAVSGSATYDAVDVARRGAFATDDIVVCYAWIGSMPGPGGGPGPNIYCATERGTTGSSLFHRGVEVETAGGRTCAVVPTSWFDTEFHDAGVYCAADRPASLTDTGYWPLNPLPSSDAVGDYTNTVGTNLSVGANHACILQGSGVLCWGDNTRGQLGDGTTTPSTTTPVPVAW